MTKSLTDLMSELPPERRARIEARTAALLAEMAPPVVAARPMPAGPTTQADNAIPGAGKNTSPES